MEVKKTGNEVERVANESAPVYKPMEATEEVLVWLGFPKTILYDKPQLWQIATFEHPAFYKDTTYHDIEVQFYNHLYVLAKLYTKHTGKTVEVEHYEGDRGSNVVYLNRKEVFSLYVDKSIIDGSLWVYKEQYLDEVKNMLQEMLNITGFDDLKHEFLRTYWREYAKTRLVEMEIFDSRNDLICGYEQKTKYEEEKKKFIGALKNDKLIAGKEAFFIIRSEFFGDDYLAEINGTRLKDILSKPIDAVYIYQNFLVFDLDKIYAVEISENEKQRILAIINSTKYLRDLLTSGHWARLLGLEKPQEVTEETLVDLGFPKILLTSGSLLWQVDDYNDKTYHDIEISFYNHLYTLAKLYTQHTRKTAIVQHRETDFGVNAVYLNKKLVLYLFVVSQYDHKKHDFASWAYKEQYLAEVKKMLQELLNTTPLDELKQEYNTIYLREYAKSNFTDVEIFNQDSLKYNTPLALLNSEQRAKYESEKREFIKALESSVFAEKEAFLITKSAFFGDGYFAEKIVFRIKDLLDKPISSLKIYQNLLVLETPEKTYAGELSESEKQKILEFINSTEYMKWISHVGYLGSLPDWDKQIM